MFSLLAVTAFVAAAAEAPDRDSGPIVQPQIVETRTIDLTQTFTLTEVPEGAKVVNLWVPVPSDAAWQRVLDRQVVAAPGEWKLVKQEEGRGEFIHVEVKNPQPGPINVQIRCIVEREGVYFPIDTNVPAAPPHRAFFQDHLDLTSHLMNVDARIKKLADEVCGDERDPAKQAAMLMKAVADKADHYSKDPSKPHCGRGSAQDCLDQGGGCCTDLHSLFIALARAREIPARLQFGYRTLDSREGKQFDPGYRCWVEYFIPGAGWVPTDIVAADGDSAENPHQWNSLAASKIWLWEGRSFELNPRGKGGPVHTMLCGWAEIDGKPVDVLPAEDGTPSKLQRTVEFKVLNRQKSDALAKLPQ